MQEFGSSHPFRFSDLANEILGVGDADGGGTIGKIVSRSIPGGGAVTIVYATDPEGNIVELLKWPQ